MSCVNVNETKKTVESVVPNSNINTSVDSSPPVSSETKKSSVKTLVKVSGKTVNNKSIHVPESRIKSNSNLVCDPHPDISKIKKPRLSMELHKEMSSLTIRPVLSDAHCREIPLTDVIIARISDRREAANLAGKLPQLPQPLGHLKRIRTRQGLLQIIIEPPATGVENPEKLVRDAFLQNHDKYKGLDLDSLRLTKVASVPPLTRRQYNAVSTFWPCNFHPDKQLEKIMSENCGFSQEELCECESNVKKMLESSQMSISKPTCLIYDPSEESKEVIICTPGVAREVHPIKHCVLMALDGVAKVQGGSSWQYGQYDIPGAFTISQTNPNARIRNGPNDYLCTGLDAYLISEPCLMCAMALLHARVKRVFFLHNSASVGALESVTKVHCLPGINHRFQVFQIQFNS